MGHSFHMVQSSRSRTSMQALGCFVLHPQQNVKAKTETVLFCYWPCGESRLLAKIPRIIPRTASKTIEDTLQRS